MREDYLWDKTGEDAEIKQLEDLLSVFRHQATDAPLPRPLAVVSPEPKRGWFFSLRFAFAAGFAAVLVAGLAFLTLPGRDIAPVARVETAAPVEPKVPDQIAAEPPVAQSQVPDPPMKSVNPPDIEKTVRPEKIVARSEKVKASPRAAKRQSSPALTAEEKHAYQQLMLALSITGSKLKIVKDAVNGTDAASEDLKKSIR